MSLFFRDINILYSDKINLFIRKETKIMTTFLVVLVTVAVTLLVVDYVSTKKELSMTKRLLEESDKTVNEMLTEEYDSDRIKK